MARPGLTVNSELEISYNRSHSCPGTDNETELPSASGRQRDVVTRPRGRSGHTQTRDRSGGARLDLIPVQQVLRGFPHVLVDRIPGDVRVAGGDGVDDLLMTGHGHVRNGPF